MNKNILKLKNAHSHDEDIEFYPKYHKYVVKSDPDSTYTSVTTWVNNHFPKFDANNVIEKIMNGSNWKPGNKYWGMTAEEIKKSWDQNRNSAANKGTNLHENIECFMNNKQLKDVSYTHADLLKAESTINNDSVEWQYFLNFIKDTPDMKPYRTEWNVFDKKTKISGSIDMVYENPDGTLEIYDWKRTKELPKTHDFNKVATNPIIGNMPDTKFWHYTIQLNTYRHILQRNYGKVVTKLCLVRLSPETDNYELLDIDMLDLKMGELFDEREKQLKNNNV